MNVLISLLIYILIFGITVEIAWMTSGILSIVVKISGIIVSLIKVGIDLYNIKKGRKSKINISPKRQLISQHIIVDRHEAFRKILSGLYSKCQVIEINGGSGIGKTYFLQVFSDLVNNKIESKIIQKKQLGFLQNKVQEYQAFYIDTENIVEFRDIIDNVSRIYFKIDEKILEMNNLLYA